MKKDDEESLPMRGEEESDGDWKMDAAVLAVYGGGENDFLERDRSRK